jgi:hypothetical protein
MSNPTTTSTVVTTSVPTPIVSTSTGVSLSNVVQQLHFTPLGRGKFLDPHASSTPRRPGDQSYAYNVAPYIPKVPSFSGDEPMPKGDCTFSEWRYEVKCLKNDPDFNEHSILVAIRRSLKGTARKIMISIGEAATASDVFDKLEDNFGIVSTKPMIMQEFYNAQQRPDESVTLFGCRLETLLQTAIESGHITRASKNEFLRTKFWSSLHSDQLRSQTRHKYDANLDYNSLLREIRQVEKELSLRASTTTSICRPKVQANAVVSDHSLEDRFQELEQNVKRDMAKFDSKFDMVLDRLDRLQVGASPSSSQTPQYGQGDYHPTPTPQYGQGDYHPPQTPQYGQGNYNPPSFQGNYNPPQPSFQGNNRFQQPSGQGSYRASNPSGPYQSNQRPYQGHGRGRGYGRGVPRGAGNGASHYPRSQPKD